MIVEEIAELLNGMEYGDEISDTDLKYARENGAVIVVGASDDLLEFYGAIQDEAGCYEGGVAPITYLDHVSKRIRRVIAKGRLLKVLRQERMKCT